MTTLTKPQQKRFTETWIFYHDGMSEHDTKLFTSLENRVECVLGDRNVFERQSVFQDYFEGNYLKNSTVFAVYLLLKYKKQGRFSIQKRLSTVLIEMGMDYATYGSQKWADAVPLCLGLFARFQEFFSGSFTHDLEILNINI